MPKSQELGYLQQEILKHFFTCREKTETVSHISKQVKSLQPAVFRSIASLIKQGYLVKEKDIKNVEKYLRLTPKGVRHVRDPSWVLDWRSFKTYDEQQVRPSFLIQLLLEVIRDADKRTCYSIRLLNTY